ncbi:hypothetical protein V8C37DRAFT_380855 [Trichoderma ceciliae]
MSFPQKLPQEAEKPAHDAPPITAPTTAPSTIPSGQVNPPAGYQPYAYTAPNGTAFPPYLGQQQAFEPPKPVPNKVWEITKMVFHTLSILLSAVGVGLSFSTLNYVYFTYTVAIGAAPACLIALVWSLAEMITRAARQFKAGIHPGAHIALSLIVFLVAVILTSLFGPWFRDSWHDDHSSNQSCSYQYNATVDNYVYVCNDSSGDDEAARRQFDRERSIAYAAAAITYIVSVIHFALFVGACVDTSKANAAASRPIYIIAQPQGFQAMMQGWQPIQQAPVQAPVQAPIQPTTRDTPPAESQDQSKNKGKGKEPLRSGDIAEH